MKSYLLIGNVLLEAANQELRIVETGTEKLILSNGHIVEGTREVLNCKRRMKRPFCVNIFDELYSINRRVRQEAEEKIRQNKLSTSSKGGISCAIKGGQSHLEDWRLRTGYTRKGIPSGRSPWNKGKNKENDKRLKVLSEDRKSEKNPMYGRTHTDENKLIASKRVKNSILIGSFTPNSNNRQTHFDVIYGGRKYRSSWEACFHSIFSHFEYEKLRIPYAFEGFTRIYIVDFVDHVGKLASEVKPSSLYNTCERTKAKREALHKWCQTNGYGMMDFDEESIYDLRDIIPFDDFDNKTKLKIQKVITRYENQEQNKDRKTGTGLQPSR